MCFTSLFSEVKPFRRTRGLVSHGLEAQSEKDGVFHADLISLHGNSTD